MSDKSKTGIIYLYLSLSLIFIAAGCQQVVDIVITRIPTGEVHFPSKSTTKTMENSPLSNFNQFKELTPVLPVESNLPCLSATAGKPLDVTVQDGTHLHPGEEFTKTWRIVNTGSCNWTKDFAVVWFSGDQLSEVKEKKINTTVVTGQTIDIIIDMKAPLKPGVYRSYWKLKDPDGNLFGIGPKGISAFWVSIEVVEVVTPSPTVTKTSTPTEIVYKKGIVALGLGDILDLDTGSINPETGGDLIYLETIDKKRALVMMNNRRLIKVVSKAITSKDCYHYQNEGERQIILTDDMDLSPLYCVMTDKSLPGYITLKEIDIVGETVYLEYTIWAIP